MAELCRQVAPLTVKGLHIGLASVVGEWLEVMGSHTASDVSAIRDVCNLLNGSGLMCAG